MAYLIGLKSGVNVLPLSVSHADISVPAERWLAELRARSSWIAPAVFLLMEVLWFMFCAPSPSETYGIQATSGTYGKKSSLPCV